MTITTTTAAVNGNDWAITVSGACPTFVGPELLEILPATANLREVRVRRGEIEKTTGRIAYISRVCDL